MHDQPAVTTFLFTDIEGSTRLWERERERMGAALAEHDAIARAAVGGHRGTLVKMSGDGLHAAFDDPLDALRATLQLQQALADVSAADGLQLKVRCALHAGVAERRDNDFFGTAVNRAARIMSAAHGGQVLLSQAAAALLADRLPKEVALRDLGPVRLRDLESAEHVYQVVHPRLEQDFPALRTLEVPPGNLPYLTTSFIGRERELAEIGALLGRERLVTLVGAGGLGKTRLSLQVAAAGQADYPDGQWFVELGALRDADLVAQAVASVLGVKEQAGRPVLEALVKFVSDRLLLLVLDNCEHLLDACAALVTQLLQAGPKLRILASSREHLHVAGEKVYTVPALAVPDPQRAAPLAELMHCEAVRLFADRAAAAHPAFTVNERNAAAVTAICRRLDGIPLALELAAARVRTLPAETIAARLDDRFQLLTRGNRGALPRQQTLRGLIDWSHDLLTERERVLFRRLAVFAGGWTLDAAEIVGSNGGLEHADVLDALTDLVEKSLVELDVERSRYRLLETVRQYAQERLDSSPDGDRARNKHLAYYLSIAEHASAELVGPAQGAWLKRLDLEGENLLAAHAWCDRADGGGELGLRLVFAVKLYMIYRGLLALLHGSAVAALARPGAQRRTQARCRALHAAGQVGIFMGRYREAQGFLEESLQIAREISDRARTGTVLEELGAAFVGQGDMTSARSYFEEALAMARELGNRRELMSAVTALGQLHRMAGELDTAEPLCEQAVALARALDDPEHIAILLLNLAMVWLGRGLHELAHNALREALTIATQIGSKHAGQSALDVCAGLAAERGEWVRAARMFGASEALTEKTGLRRDPADETFLAPLIARVRVALGVTEFAAAETAGRALSYEAATSETRAWLSC